LRDPTAGQFIVVEGTEDAFADYVRGVAESRVAPWAAAQDNYRGASFAVGAPTGVVAAFDQAVDGARAQVSAARAGLDRAVDDLRRNS
jgi:hypothetical protein